MGKDSHIKDARVKSKHAGRNLTQLIDKAMAGGPGRGGAEAAGLRALAGLCQLFILGEGPLPDAMRELVRLLHDKSDALRRDIPPEVWAALWPTLNALVEGRRKCLEQLEAARRVAVPEVAGGAPEVVAPAVDAGPGILRADSAAEGAGGGQC